MKTLLQINVVANSGSTGKIAEDIGRLVMSKGWRSVIAYGRWANPSQNELIRIGSDFGNKEHAIESRLFDNHGLASRSTTKNFIRQVDAINPDVIHLHNIHGYYINYPQLFQYLTEHNIPVVWTLHDCWPFTGHCVYFDVVNCGRWKTECHPPCPAKRDYPASILADGARRNWNLKRQSFTSVRNMTMVPVSEWLSDLLENSFLGNYPVEVIHNGINIDVFHPVERSEDLLERYAIQHKHIILGVSNMWEERKGLKDFIKLRGLLSDDWIIVLVGVNEKQRSNLPDGIVGISRTENQQELVGLYSSADIFLNLTYEDNYPTTNLEAMACGTPVITYETGGSPEAVTPETGWVVEQGNITEVASIINDLSSVSVEKVSLRRKICRMHAEQFFDKEKCFEQYLALYERILDNNNL